MNIFRIAAVLAVFHLALPAHAITINGFTANGNNRWVENPPNNPTGPFTPNTDPAFVGLNYDFSGVGWQSSNTGSWRNLGVTLISPMHFAQATHVNFSYTNTTYTFANRDNVLVSRSIGGTLNKADIASSGIGLPADARVVRLDRGFTPSDKVTVYRLLDVGSVNNATNYPAVLMGHDGSSSNWQRRVALSSVSLSDETNNKIYFNTITPPVNHATAYVSGDSGHPSFLVYEGNLHFVGTHHYANLADENWMHPTGFPGVNAFLSADGYALRWTIDSTKAKNWNGNIDGTFATPGNWLDGSGPPSPTISAVFSGTETANRSITLDAPATVRGIRVKAAPGANPFTLSGSTLTLRESGLRNEDADTLTINSAITLAGSQNWEAESGPITIGGNVATAGFLVVLSGDQALTLSGNLTGTGSVAWDNPGTWTPASGQLALTTGKLFVHRGTVNLTTANTYSGGTVVTGGTLLVNNSSGSATGSGPVTLAGDSRLGGNGTIAGTVTLQNAGGLAAHLTTAPGLHDKLDITGALALGASGTLTVTATAGVTTGTYTLATAAGGITGSLPALSLPSDWSTAVQISGNNLNLVITSLIPSVPFIAGGQSPSGIAGSFFSYQIAASQSPTSYALTSGSLPPGVTLNTTTGVLSGTPTTPGSYAPGFTATNALGTSSAVTVNITISRVLTGTYIGTAGSWNNNPASTGDKAFDGNTTTFFDSAIATGSWVGLDLGAAYAITEIRYFPRSTFAARMRGGIFQGSSTADFSSGVVNLFSISADPSYAWNTVTVSASGTFRYVRYLAAGSNSYGNVAEVEFRGISAFQAFRSSHALPADGSQDTAAPAGDGVANLLKYAFNMLGSGSGQSPALTTPNATTLAPGGSAGLPFPGFGTGPDADKLQITYIRRKASTSPGITYAVEFSADLGLTDPWSGNPSATETTISLDASLERVTVTDSLTNPGKRFVRVKVGVSP